MVSIAAILKNMLRLQYDEMKLLGVGTSRCLDRLKGKCCRVAGCKWMSMT